MTKEAEPRTFVVDGATSRLTVRTRATGLLAKLAHDLEMVANDVRGKAGASGDAWSADLVVPVSELRVAGVVRGGRVDRSVLSASDIGEIERRMRADVFAGASEVSASAQGTTRARGEVTVRIGRASATSTTAPAVTEVDGALVATGTVDLRLSALGVREIKGPLGAFKVSDVVVVTYELRLLAP